MIDKLTIDGIQYYIDLDAISNYIQITPDQDPDQDQDKETEYNVTIDISKYEIIKYFVETIMSFDVIPPGADEDEIERLIRRKNKTGIDLQTMPLSFKLAYNTLLHYEILKKWKNR